MCVSQSPHMEWGQNTIISPRLIKIYAFFNIFIKGKFHHTPSIKTSSVKSAQTLISRGKNKHSQSNERKVFEYESS